MNVRAWFTPKRVVALLLVGVGSALQIYALVNAGSSHLQGIGIGLLILGAFVELVGQRTGEP